MYIVISSCGASTLQEIKAWNCKTFFPIRTTKKNIHSHHFTSTKPTKGPDRVQGLSNNGVHNTYIHIPLYIYKYIFQWLWMCHTVPTKSRSCFWYLSKGQGNSPYLLKPHDFCQQEIIGGKTWWPSARKHEWKMQPVAAQGALCRKQNAYTMDPKLGPQIWKLGYQF